MSGGLEPRYVALVPGEGGLTEPPNNVGGLEPRYVAPAPGEAGPSTKFRSSASPWGVR